MGWLKLLNFDPMPALLASSDEALVFFARRDLLGEEPGSIQDLWRLPGALRILKWQLPNGSWPRPGVHKHPAINEGLIETRRQLRFLVEKFGFTRQHPQVEKAAAFIFSCQSEAGDLRGILANQYATYYTGAILALLIQAGYTDVPRIEKSFLWLLSMRQNDGGWTIPLLTHQFDRATQYRLTTEFTTPVEPDRSKPFSHHWTGMVLRAFAVHPVYRTSEAALTAAHLLKSRFFQPDAYTSYQSAIYWVRFEYPFWWNNLLTELDSLSRIGLSGEDEKITLEVRWLVDHQEESGLWKVSYMKEAEKEKETAQAEEIKQWISLAICRVMRRFYG